MGELLILSLNCGSLSVMLSLLHLFSSTDRSILQFVRLHGMRESSSCHRALFTFQAIKSVEPSKHSNNAKRKKKQKQQIFDVR